MIQLSAVIITLNEEAKIGACLESLEGAADEIVVVDSFSTDKTESICRAHGVRFLQHAFKGYVEQIRFAVTQARFPYVLSIDADEALSPELRESIQTARQNFAFDGYVCHRLNHYCGHPIRHGAWYPDKKIRLWKTDKGEFGGLNPHYTVVMQPGTRLGALKGDLLHYSYDSLSEHLEQTGRFAEIGAQAALAAGKGVRFPMLYLRPLLRFVRDYILKRGFLDGFDGLTIAVVSAFGNYLKYARLYQLRHANRI